MYGKKEHLESLSDEQLLAELIRTVSHICWNHYEPCDDPIVHAEWKDSAAYQKQIEGLILGRMQKP